MRTAWILFLSYSYLILILTLFFVTSNDVLTLSVFI